MLLKSFFISASQLIGQGRQHTNDIAENQFNSFKNLNKETNYAKWAELITAAKYLDWAEADHFWDEETERLRKQGEPPFVDLTFKPPQTTHRIITLMTNNNAYRQIFDRLIGRRGVLALLDTPSLANFDRAMDARIDHMHIVSDLIDYRLRYIQHCIGNGKVNADPDGENLNHAKFFFWWPTREVQSSRGKTSPNKAVSTKTMRIWWGIFENSALFIYLIHKHGFRQLPMDTDDDVFMENLLRESNNTEELLRFFGAYAYVAEAFRNAQSDLIYVSVSESIPRIPISTAPFSKTELETINQYDGHYLEMTE